MRVQVTCVASVKRQKWVEHHVCKHIRVFKDGRRKGNYCTWILLQSIVCHRMGCMAASATGADIPDMPYRFWLSISALVQPHNPHVI
jgi:hypothetical protein